MKIPIELELSDDENRRNAYRAPVDDKVSMTIDDKPVTLLDISETGVAFETTDHLSGKIENAVILFTLDKSYRLKPALNVSFCGAGRCGAEFDGLSEKASLVLSELIIDIQKTRIRQAAEDKFQVIDKE
ncbi:MULTISPECIES: PilZ domain-containing protein [unclassified Neptuniibacter]|jgi:hypothetical protein|uniref:PilZ domain-containing protein n=1 Tax=unclassified Neptuniibacter TaxID=2630693 RepID=UPI0026E33A7B|nr:MULTISPECIES: PilZ domain-containing protein [unclassified Neptuniibacter]MDO6512728.1 PilZ domain-containing protein [Neptuniibacter sp. 2_MG-2023]MDO6593088.1 PilZ domain-containing protein [Neptuniibacter sp. 1_MG-2023]